MNEFILQLKTRLDLGDDALSDLIEAPVKAVRAILDGRRQVKLYEMILLCQRLGLDMESLISGRVDLEALRCHRQGELNVFPERYSFDPRSRVFSALVYLDFLEERMGWWERQNILRKFQLTEEGLSSPSRMISMSFFKALTEHLHEYMGFDFGNFYEIGRQSLRFRIGEFVSSDDSAKASADDVISFYDRFCQDQAVDLNCTHRILKASPNEIWIETRDRPEACDALKTQTVGNHWVSAYVAGAYSTFPQYFGYGAGHATLLADRHFGDPATITRIQFDRS